MKTTGILFPGLVGAFCLVLGYQGACMSFAPGTCQARANDMARVACSGDATAEELARSLAEEVRKREKLEESVSKLRKDHGQLKKTVEGVDARLVRVEQHARPIYGSHVFDHNDPDSNPGAPGHGAKGASKVARLYFPEGHFKKPPKVLVSLQGFDGRLGLQPETTVNNRIHFHVKHTATPDYVDIQFDSQGDHWASANIEFVAFEDCEKEEIVRIVKDPKGP